LAAIHTKECAMPDFLFLRAADLSWLAMTIQTNLESAEDTIHSINHTLTELASRGCEISRSPDRWSTPGRHARRAMTPIPSPSSKLFC